MRGKAIIALTIAALILPTVLSQGMTASDIRNMLRDQNQLNELKDMINQGLDGAPDQVSIIIGTDRVYHARIGSNNVAIILSNSRVSSITPGTPDNPTHIIYASESTVLQIANAEDPVSTAINAVLQGQIIITTAPQCSEDSACDDNQVCNNGQCEDAYTIAVVPIAYSANQYSDFYNKAKPEMDLVLAHIPMDTNKIRIHYVNPSVCPDYTCNDVCRDCQNTARDCVARAGLVGVADKVVGVSRDDVSVMINGQPYLLCGCAGGIPAYTSVSRSRLYVDQGVYCYMTVVHELGHQLGLYHVDSTGEEGGACQGPNAADCQESNKASDIMGYGWPQDHFGPAATSYLRTNVLGGYQ